MNTKKTGRHSLGWMGGEQKTRMESVAWNTGIIWEGGSDKWQSFLDDQLSKNYLCEHGSLQDSNFCTFLGNVKR